MKKRAQAILSKERVFVGLEDSKKTWQLCVRSGGVIIHETSMPAKFEVLRLLRIELHTQPKNDRGNVIVLLYFGQQFYNFSTAYESKLGIPDFFVRWLVFR